MKARLTKGRVRATSAVPLSSFARSKMYSMGLRKPRQEDATRFQHAEGLAPNGPHIRHEVIRHRMKNQVEALVSKLREVRHIAVDGFEIKMVPLSHQTVVRELLYGSVQHGHLGPAAARGPCCPPPAASARTSAPRSAGNQSRGTGFDLMRYSYHAPRRAAAICSRLTGVLQRPSA